jgi:hypothetical protein
VAGAPVELDHVVVALDGRGFEPTPSGFLAAQALDRDGLGSPQAAAATALGGAKVGTLVVDSYERPNLLDAWLRNEFPVD